MRGATKAINLRKTQTDAEARIWWYLRDRRLGGYKFRRQHAVGKYIVDFVCLERRLVVEIDGGQHLEQIACDRRRTAFLRGCGLAVLRYWNDDVLLHTERVLEDVMAHLINAPHPDPLPARGEREHTGCKQK